MELLEVAYFKGSKVLALRVDGWWSNSYTLRDKMTSHNCLLHNKNFRSPARNIPYEATGVFLPLEFMR